MPSQAVSAPVPHLGGTAAAADRAAGVAGLPDAARAVVGMATAVAVRARAARRRRSAVRTGRPAGRRARPPRRAVVVTGADTWMYRDDLAVRSLGTPGCEDHPCSP